MAEFRIPLDYKEKVGRAVHDVSQIKRTTMHPGLLYPLYYRRMKRGEKCTFATPQMLLQSQPTYSPVMGQYRLRVEWYFNSDANHYGWIDNDSRLTTEEVLHRRHHTIRFENIFGGVVGDTNTESIGTVNQYYDKYGVGRGGIYDFMGIPPGYIPLMSGADLDGAGFDGVYPDNSVHTTHGHYFNLDMILTYLNIIRCYHINQQYPDIPYVSEDLFNPDGDRELYFATYNQQQLDDLFMALRCLDNGFDFDAANVPSTSEMPSKYQFAIRTFNAYLQSSRYHNGGLFCSQYQPDLYRNLLNNDIDLYKSTVKVNEDGSFSIESFRFDNRIQMILDRINPFGGKDSTLSRTRWGVRSNKNYDIPMYICSQTEFIDTTAVTSNNSGSASVDGESITSVPGELSGNVNQRKYNKSRQSFTADVPGTLMAIVSLVPVVDYSQNIEHWLLQNNFEDEFSPQMAQRGFEDVPITDYVGLPMVAASVDSADSPVVSYGYDDVVGKQIAWIHDMTAVNRVHGEFTTFGFYHTWVLGRNFLRINHEISEEEGVVTGFSVESVITPYVNPNDWQYPFVAQTLFDPNFYLQCMFDVKSVSPVGYRFMPTLE